MYPNLSHVFFVAWYVLPHWSEDLSPGIHKKKHELKRIPASLVILSQMKNWNKNQTHKSYKIQLIIFIRTKKLWSHVFFDLYVKGEFDTPAVQFLSHQNNRVSEAISHRGEREDFQEIPLEEILHLGCAKHCKWYIPGTQMTLGLVGKDLVLMGWPSKVEVIGVLGIYIYTISTGDRRIS